MSSTAVQSEEIDTAQVQTTDPEEKASDIWVRGLPSGDLIKLTKQAVQIPTDDQDGKLWAKIDGENLEVVFEFGSHEFHHSQLSLARLGSKKLQINAGAELGLVVNAICFGEDE